MSAAGGGTEKQSVNDKSGEQCWILTVVKTERKAVKTLLNVSWQKANGLLEMIGQSTSYLIDSSDYRAALVATVGAHLTA